MPKKTFTTAPKPKQPTDEQILAFEKGGTGHDQKNSRIPTKQAEEPKKRLAIDLPASLHKRFKTACAQNDTQMAAEVLAFIEKRTTQME